MMATKVQDLFSAFLEVNRSLYEVQRNTGHRSHDIPESASSIQATI